MNYSAQAFSGNTLVDLLRDRADNQSSRIAYRFLVDGETQTLSLSYEELDRHSRSIAAHLQSLCSPGERVLLLYPPGLEYITAFFGCLYAGAIAVPAYPPRPNRSFSRLQSIAIDSGATIALTTRETFSVLARRGADSPALSALKWLATDLLEDAAIDWQVPDADSTTVAFLQYTSGSTADPKGVRVTHGNLLHNLEGIYRSFGLGAESHVVSWLPVYHDMGLIGGILQPLYGGFPVTLMSPLMFLQKPLRWLQAISHYQATCSGGPNFAYDLCTRKIAPEHIAELDLSRWRVAFNGAEPISATVLERFAQAFAPAGFRSTALYPCYGLAEATLFASGGNPSEPPRLKTVGARELERHRVVETDLADGENARVLVSCGRPLPDQHVAIVHPDTRALCAPDEVGEIWIFGASVADGYWQNPTATEELFRARLAVGESNGKMPKSDDRSFLRTGDLGFLDGGELFVTGRLKDMTIVNGRNYYPQDVEWTVEGSHPSVRPHCTAAFSVDVEGEERAVVVAEIERSYLKGQGVDRSGEPEDDAPEREIVEAIRRAVAREHELPIQTVLLLKPGSLPKTSSGKIQRRACRASFLDGTFDRLAWWSPDSQ